MMKYLQKIGRALLVPVAVLPAAGLLLRLGADDVLGWQWMFKAGAAVFDNLPVIFAIGVAIGLAEGAGVAGLASFVGYQVMVNVAKTINADINMSVFAGIISGIVAASLYGRYKDIKLPDFLGFFGGRRFVPIVTAFAALILGAIFGVIWPPIQEGIRTVGEWAVGAGPVGAFVFGTLNRLLIPVGLHHVINTFAWFSFGEFTDAAGKVVQGDLWRFFAGDQTAGQFMTGFFPIFMFGLPAACLAMWHEAKTAQRKIVSGVLMSAALTSFVTGITEPVEFAFMFLAPILYVLHALLTGLSLAITNLLGIKDGFMFSAGFIDYVINYGIASKPILLLVVGVGYGLVYYFGFRWVIRAMNLPTPGRVADEGVTAEEAARSIKEKAVAYLAALGGKDNIKEIGACITRLRLTLNDENIINEKAMKAIGATGVMKMGKNVQVVVGFEAEQIADEMKKL